MLDKLGSLCGCAHGAREHNQPSTLSEAVHTSASCRAIRSPRVSEGALHAPSLNRHSMSSETYGVNEEFARISKAVSGRANSMDVSFLDRGSAVVRVEDSEGQQATYDGPPSWSDAKRLIKGDEKINDLASFRGSAHRASDGYRRDSKPGADTHCIRTASLPKGAMRTVQKLGDEVWD